MRLVRLLVLRGARHARLLGDQGQPLARESLQRLDAGGASLKAGALPGSKSLSPRQRPGFQDWALKSQSPSNMQWSCHRFMTGRQFSWRAAPGELTGAR